MSPRAQKVFIGPVFPITEVGAPAVLKGHFIDRDVYRYQCNMVYSSGSQPFSLFGTGHITEYFRNVVTFWVDRMFLRICLVLMVLLSVMSRL